MSVAGLVVRTAVAAAAVGAELVARLPMSSGSGERVPLKRWTVEESFSAATFPSRQQPVLAVDDQQ